MDGQPQPDGTSPAGVFPQQGGFTLSDDEKERIARQAAQDMGLRSALPAPTPVPTVQAGFWSRTKAALARRVAKEAAEGPLRVGKEFVGGEFNILDKTTKAIEHGALEGLDQISNTVVGAVAGTGATIAKTTGLYKLVNDEEGEQDFIRWWEQRTQDWNPLQLGEQRIARATQPEQGGLYGVVEDISQFGVSLLALRGAGQIGPIKRALTTAGKVKNLAPVAKVLGKVPQRAAVIAKEAAEGFAAQSIGFDPFLARLSNQIQNGPDWMRNPVTEFLQASPDDSEAEARLKNGLEGALTDVAFLSLLSGLKYAKRLIQGGPNAQEEAAAALARATEGLDKEAQDLYVVQETKRGTFKIVPKRDLWKYAPERETLAAPPEAPAATPESPGVSPAAPGAEPTATAAAPLDPTGGVGETPDTPFGRELPPEALDTPLRAPEEAPVAAPEAAPVAPEAAPQPQPEAAPVTPAPAVGGTEDGLEFPTRAAAEMYVATANYSARYGSALPEPRIVTPELLNEVKQRVKELGDNPDPRSVAEVLSQTGVNLRYVAQPDEAINYIKAILDVIPGPSVATRDIPVPVKETQERAAELFKGVEGAEIVRNISALFGKTQTLPEEIYAARVAMWQLGNHVTRLARLVDADPSNAVAASELAKAMNSLVKLSAEVLGTSSNIGRALQIHQVPVTRRQTQAGRKWRRFFGAGEDATSGGAPGAGAAGEGAAGEGAAGEGAAAADATDAGKGLFPADIELDMSQEQAAARARRAAEAQANPGEQSPPSPAALRAAALRGELQGETRAPGDPVPVEPSPEQVALDADEASRAAALKEGRKEDAAVTKRPPVLKGEGPDPFSPKELRGAELRAEVTGRKDRAAGVGVRPIGARAKTAAEDAAAYARERARELRQPVFPSKGARPTDAQLARRKILKAAPATAYKQLEDYTQAEIRSLARMLVLNGGDPAETLSTILGTRRLQQQAALAAKEQRLGVRVLRASQSITNKIVDFKVAMILTAPVTQGAAFVGNTLATATLPLRYIAAGLRARDKQLLRFGADMYAGLWYEMSDAWKMAAKTFEVGDNPLDPSNSYLTGSTSQLPQWSTASWLSRVYGLPRRLLVTQDGFFKALDYRANIRAQILEKARADGITDPIALARRVEEDMQFATNPLGEATNGEALRLAREGTFTKRLDEGAYEGSLGSGVNWLINSFPPLRFLSPFTKIGINFFRWTWESAPLLNRINAQVRDDFKAGGRRAQLAQAKVDMGAAIWTTGVLLVASKNMSGGGPSDPNLRAALLATGWRPYSLRIPGTNRWISLLRADPVLTPIRMVADIAELTSEMDERTVTSMSAAFLGSVLKSVTSQTFNRGIADFFQMAMSGDAKRVETFLKRQVMSFWPNILKAVNPDPVYREVQTLLDEIRARTPGWSTTLEPRRNMFGEPVLLPPGGPLGMNRWMNPFTVSNPMESPDQDVAVKLLELGRAFSMPAETRMGGLINLRDRKRYDNGTGQSPADRMLEWMSKPTNGLPSLRQQMERLVQSDAYENASPGDPVVQPGGLRYQMAAQIVAAYQNAAWGVVLKEYPKLQQAIQQGTEVKAAGLVGGQDGVDAVLAKYEQIFVRTKR